MGVPFFHGSYNGKHISVSCGSGSQPHRIELYEKTLAGKGTSGWWDAIILGAIPQGQLMVSSYLANG